MFNNKLTTQLIVAVSAIVIINQSLFFSFMGLLGANYEGAEESNVYIFYLTASFLLILLSYVYATILKRLSRNELLAWLIIIYYLFVHLLWVMFDPTRTKLIPLFMVHFFLLGFVGFVAGLTIAKLNLMERLIKVSELLFVAQAAGIATYSVINTLIGIKTASLAGATYQALSYYSAFTLGMLTLYCFILPPDLRYHFTKSIIYRLITYALIMACALGTLIGGGRGAFLLMVAYLVLASYYIFFKHKKLSVKNIRQIFLRIIAIAALVSLFVIFFGDKDFIQSGFNRATQFISQEGIDLERGSSGRDRVYAKSWEYILEQPLLGYGPFGVRDKAIHAHNVFLEIWLQFGLFPLIIISTSCIFLLLRTKNIIAHHRSWLYFLVLYPIIMIQFSGTYLTAPSIWFFIGYSIAHKEQLTSFKTR